MKARERIVGFVGALTCVLGASAFAGQSPGPIVVEGTVRWDDGQPAAGADVVGMERGGRRTCDTRAAVDGSFRLICDGPSALDVVAFALGAGEPRHDVEMIAPFRGRYTPRVVPWHGVELVVRRPTTISGTVLEPDGKPAQGAQVRWTPGAVMGIDVPGEAVTDAQGRFALRSIRRDTPVAVVAFSERHAPVKLDGVRPGTSNLVVRFSRGGVVTGRVSFLTGGVAPRATVELTQSDRAAFAAMRSATASLDVGRATVFARRPVRADGSFEVTGVGAGRFDVCVKGEPGPRGCLEDVEVGEGRTTGPLTVAVADVSLRGRVVEAGTGRPLAGIPVYRGIPSGRPGDVKATTALDGTFFLPGAVLGRSVLVSIFPPGHDYVIEPRLVRPVAERLGDVGDLPIMKEPADTESRRGTVGLAPGPSLAGVVVDDLPEPSPARAAGVAIGDLVESVDGESVTALGPGSVRVLLGGPPGSVVDLGLVKASNGAKVHVRLERVQKSGVR